MKKTVLAGLAVASLVVAVIVISPSISSNKKCDARIGTLAENSKCFGTVVTGPGKGDLQ